MTQMFQNNHSNGRVVRQFYTLKLTLFSSNLAVEPPPIDPMEAQINMLEQYLEKLPDFLPLDNARKYEFRNFKLPESDIELTGTEQGGLNRRLEIIFGNRRCWHISFIVSFRTQWPTSGPCLPLPGSTRQEKTNKRFQQ